MKKSFYEKSLKMTRIFFVAALCLSLTGINTFASSHAEAPLISMDRYADNTDVYAFRSSEAGRAGFVTIIANFIPFQDPSGGPQFYRFDDTVLYEIKIDNTGDGLQDITYQFQFTTQILNRDTVFGMNTINIDGRITSLTDLDYNMPQNYTVRRIDSSNPTGQVLATGLRMPPSNIGPRVTPNYEANLAQPAIYPLGTGGAGGRVFVGQRDEGFFIDVGAVFDAAGFRSLARTGGVDSLRGFNVNTIAIEVPIQNLTRNGTVPTSTTDPAAVIGVFSTASRGSMRAIAPNGDRSQTGFFVPISRLGSPLINEVVIPLRLKDAFNSLSPANDAIAAPAIFDPEFPKIIRQAIGAFGTFNGENPGGGLPVINLPPAPRNDIAAIFAFGITAGSVPGAPTFTTTLTDGSPHEYLRLNVAIAPVSSGMAGFSRLGLLGNDIGGFPNGRRVEDDVVDIEIRALLGGTPFTPAFNVAPNNLFSDGVSGNFEGFLTRFPYLQTPNQGNQVRLTNFPALQIQPGNLAEEEEDNFLLNGYPDLKVKGSFKN